MELCEALVKAGAGALRVEGTVWVRLLYGKERDPGMWPCRLIKGYLPWDIIKQGRSWGLFSSVWPAPEAAWASQANGVLSASNVEPTLDETFVQRFGCNFFCSPHNNMT